MSFEKMNAKNIPQWSSRGYDYKGVVHYGMEYIYGNSQPYFSITVDTFCKSSKSNRWKEDGGGCQHDLIESKLPELAELIPYHLSGQDGLPVYYLENGYYWYKENLEIFKSYIRLSDDEIIPEKLQQKINEQAKKKFITDWLKSRESKLKQEFDAVMSRFGVGYITPKEIAIVKASFTRR